MTTTPSLRGTPERSDRRHRTGGRSARIRASVHQAVEELVTEVDGETLTMPMIAARAGVHPTTLYRRWKTIGELLAAVARSRFTGDLVVPDTGSLQGDLEAWAVEVATDLSDHETAALMRAAVGAGPGAGCACVEDRFQQLGAIIERAGSQLSVEEAADSLLGPLYFRTLFTEAPGDSEWARSLVDRLLARH